MADILQTTFSDALSGVKNIVCETKLHLLNCKIALFI